MLRDLSPLFGYMRRYRWGYVWGTLACVATNAIWVQFPRVLKIAVDELQKKHATRNSILYLAGLLILISLVKGVFLYSQRWILIGISRDIEYDLRNDLFRKLERQDSDFYQRYRTGDIMARMTNDLNAVRMLLGPALMYSANTIFFTVGALYFLLRISPYLTLVALAPMPLASILVQYFGSRIHNRFERILRTRRIPDRYLRAAQSRVHPPLPPPSSIDGHVVADAGVHPRPVHADYAAGGWA
jgi:ATP-binding cassette subfamily B protein